MIIYFTYSLVYISMGWSNEKGSWVNMDNFPDFALNKDYIWISFV